jgi:hypothetical protein
MKFDIQTYRLSEADNIGRNLFLLGGVAFIATCLGLLIDSKQFFFSYLVAYVFWVTLGLGGLFFVLLNHLTGSVWCVVLRRITESIMITLPYMVILFIPLLFGLHDIYHWSHEDAVVHDAILQKKSAYLNVPFFVIRTLIYFTLWFLIARKLYKSSLEQDKKPLADQIKTMRRVSAPGMVVFALSTSFAAFDWLMSLDPHWYSTIFGLYVFSGGLLAFLAFITLFCIWLRKHNVLVEIITIEHYHDLTKLILAFTIFWGYMGFSQYFLIWYANIPEETIFYLHRWEGSWKVFSLTLVLGHFLLPFVLLLPRASKRNFGVLKFITIWLLIMHWVDMYWLAMPILHHHGIHLSWMDLTAFLAIGGLFIAILWRYLSRSPLVPVKEPGLENSIAFKN